MVDDVATTFKVTARQYGEFIRKAESIGIKARNANFIVAALVVGFIKGEYDVKQINYEYDRLNGRSHPNVKTYSMTYHLTHGITSKFIEAVEQCGSSRCDTKTVALRLLIQGFIDGEFVIPPHILVFSEKTRYLGKLNELVEVEKYVNSNENSTLRSYNYQIGTKLVNAFKDKCNSKGLRTQSVFIVLLENYLKGQYNVEDWKCEWSRIGRMYGSGSAIAGKMNVALHNTFREYFNNYYARGTHCTLVNVVRVLISGYIKDRIRISEEDEFKCRHSLCFNTYMGSEVGISPKIKKVYKITKDKRYLYINGSGETVPKTVTETKVVKNSNVSCHDYINDCLNLISRYDLSKIF